MDLNSGLGKIKGKLVADEVVGAHDAGVQNFAGDTMREMMAEHDLAAINSYFPVGTTYEGAQGWRSRIDYLVAPQSLRPMVARCCALRRQCKKVQASPYFVDHVPIAMYFSAPSPAQPRMQQ